MRERCSKHGLAVGPDGTCVLCRSRRPAEPKPHVALVVVALFAVGAGLFVWRITRAPLKLGPLRLELASAEPASIALLPAQSTTGSPTGAPTDRVESHVFVERDPRGLASELRSRGEVDVGGQYFAGKETYELFLPAAAVVREPHGLLVWISSDPSGALADPEWRRILAKHRLVWVGPNRVGNDREIALRIGLALDSVRAARQRFTLDESRVYVSGISGGAKSAFRAQLFYPEVFRGALLAAGIEYYRDVAARSRAAGSLWPARIGKPTNLELAKTRAVALTTGPNDFNYGQISDVVAAMHEDAFVRVQIFSWQNLGHAPPPADALDRALTWLEIRK